MHTVLSFAHVYFQAASRRSISVGSAAEGTSTNAHLTTQSPLQLAQLGVACLCAIVARLGIRYLPFVPAAHDVVLQYSTSGLQWAPLTGVTDKYR